MGAGYLTSCVVLMHENRETLQDWARELRRTVQTLGFGCRIETINALETWLGSIPGNSFSNLRRPLLSTLNLADLLPLSSVWEGAAHCPCPFYPPDSPPLAVLTTDGPRRFFSTSIPAILAIHLYLGLPAPASPRSWGWIAAQFRRYAGRSDFRL